MPLIIDPTGGFDDTHNPRFLPASVGRVCRDVNLRYGRFDMRPPAVRSGRNTNEPWSVYGNCNLFYVVSYRGGQGVLYSGGSNRGDCRLRFMPGNGVDWEHPGYTPMMSSFGQPVNYLDTGAPVITQTVEPMSVAKFGDSLFIAQCTDDFAVVEIRLGGTTPVAVRRDDIKPCRLITSHMGYMILGGVWDMDMRVVMATDLPMVAGSPTFDANHFEEVPCDPDASVTALVGDMYDGLYVFTSRTVERMDGPPTNWVRTRILDVGTLAGETVQVVDGYIYFLGHDGIPYRTNGRPQMAERVGSFRGGRPAYFDSRSPIDTGLRNYKLGAATSGSVLDKYEVADFTVKYGTRELNGCVRPQLTSGDSLLELANRAAHPVNARPIHPKHPTSAAFAHSVCQPTVPATHSPGTYAQWWQPTIMYWGSGGGNQFRLPRENQRDVDGWDLWTAMRMATETEAEEDRRANSLNPLLGLSRYHSFISPDVTPYSKLPFFAQGKLVKRVFVALRNGPDPTTGRNPGLTPGSSAQVKCILYRHTDDDALSSGEEWLGEATTTVTVPDYCNDDIGGVLVEFDFGDGVEVGGVGEWLRVTLVLISGSPTEGTLEWPNAYEGVYCSYAKGGGKSKEDVGHGMETSHWPKATSIVFAAHKNDTSPPSNGLLSVRVTCQPDTQRYTELMSGFRWGRVAWEKGPNSGDHWDLVVELDCFDTGGGYLGKITVPQSGQSIGSLVDPATAKVRPLVRFVSPPTVPSPRVQSAGYGNECAELLSVAVGQLPTQAQSPTPFGFAWDGRYCLSLERVDSAIGTRDLYVWETNGWSRWENTNIARGDAIYDDANRWRFMFVRSVEHTDDDGNPRYAVCCFSKEDAESIAKALHMVGFSGDEPKPLFVSAERFLASGAVAQISKILVSYDMHPDAPKPVGSDELGALVRVSIDGGEFVDILTSDGYGVRPFGSLNRNLSTRRYERLGISPISRGRHTFNEEPATIEGRVLSLAIGGPLFAGDKIQGLVGVDYVIVDAEPMSERFGEHAGERSSLDG